MLCCTLSLQEKGLLRQQLEEARSQLKEAQQNLEKRVRETNDLQEGRNIIEQQYMDIAQKLEAAERKLIDYQNSLKEMEAEL